MSQQLTDSQLRAAIMDFVLKKGRGGAHYYPVDTLVNFLGRRVRPNSKRVFKTIRELVKERYLLPHKKGDTVSLNSARKSEILDYISRYTQTIT